MTETRFGRALRGATAGTAATIVMSAEMLAAQRLGLMGRQPPEVIAAHLTGDPDSPVTDVLAVAAHLAFGAGSGAVYALLAPPRRTGPVSATVYALAVWAASYQGWVPALGILPPADRDRPGRPAAMIIAHVVFGASLGWLLSRGQGPARPGTTPGTGRSHAVASSATAGGRWRRPAAR